MKLDGRTLHCPASELSDPASCYKWAVVTELTEWEVLPVAFVSPRHFWSSARPSASSAGIAAMETGSPMPLLEAAAREGFRDIAAPAVRAMCKDLGVEVAEGWNLFELLQAALRFSIPQVLDNDILAVLHRRLTPEQLVDSEFWSQEEVRGCFDQGDVDFIERYQNEFVGAKKSSVAYKSLWEYTRQVQAAAAKSAPTLARAPRTNARASATERRFNPKPADLLPEGEAQKFLPEGAKVWKDGRENRWVVRFSPFGSLSRSWTVYGEVGALGRVAAWAWEKAVESGRCAKCPHQWIAEYDWRSGA